jgi:hypothetical protein
MAHVIQAITRQTGWINGERKRVSDIRLHQHCVEGELSQVVVGLGSFLLDPKISVAPKTPGESSIVSKRIDRQLWDVRHIGSTDMEIISLRDTHKKQQRISEETDNMTSCSKR